MTGLRDIRSLVLGVIVVALGATATAQPNKYARDPRQAIDDEYTKKI